MDSIFNKIRNFYFKKKFKSQKVDFPEIILSDIWKGNSNVGSNINNSKDPINEISSIETFDFIRDLKSYGTSQSRYTARKIINYWIESNTNLFSDYFSSILISNRICILSFTYSWFASSGEIAFQKKILNFIYIQLILQENFNKKEKNRTNFKTLKSLIIGNVFLFNDHVKINNYLIELNNLSKNLILGDGGHVSRCPIEQLGCLRDLIEIRASVASLKKINTLKLHNLVKKMSDYFKIFCVKKNTFSSFNSGSLISKNIISQTVKRLTTSRKNFISANYSGYVSITSNNLDLIIDAGNKQLLTSSFTKKNKASITAFELFYSKNKIITNVGTPHLNKNNELNFRAIASTAAHSTLSIDNRNNLDLDKKRQIDSIIVKSSESKNGYLINLKHSGYKEIFGINHSRILFISKKDQDLRGEDTLVNYGNIGSTPRIATLRFHLYHNIQPIKLQNGSILLQDFEGKVFGTFYSNKKNSLIKDTVIYEEYKKFKSKQIIIEVPINEIKEVDKIIIKWSFKFGKLI